MARFRRYARGSVRGMSDAAWRRLNADLVARYGPTPEPRFTKSPAECRHMSTFCPGSRERDYTRVCMDCGTELVKDGAQ